MSIGSYGVEVIEIPRGAYVRRTKLIHEVKESKIESSAKLLTSVVQSILFEINKTRFRVKHSCSPVSSSDLKDDDNELHKKHSNRSILLQKQLTDQLSSLSVFPTSPSPLVISRSSPALYYNLSAKKANIFALSDILLVKIASSLDGKSVHMLSQTCKKFRTLLMDNAQVLSKRLATAYEIVLGFNKLTQNVDVRAMKIGRSIYSISFKNSSITEVVPKLINCLGKVTFGTGVVVSNWTDEISRMYKEGRLTPVSFIFNGGNLSKGSKMAGADLRGFSESSFISFINSFTPHLQELQLATSKLFRPCTTTAGLLSLISQLTSFGICYERPGLRYYFEDVRRVISNWRFDPLSRNCAIFLRYPRASNPQMWSDCGGTVEIVNDKIEKVIVPHVFLEGVELAFRFH